MRLIEVVPYSSEWQHMFAEEAARIKAALGENCIAIHHIGSTSIPGLCAKPVIDMLPVVRDILKVDACNAAMKALRYEAKGEFGIPFRRYFQKGGENRTHHVHLFEEGNPEIERHLKFRDYLRTHEDDRTAYGNLKERLAEQFPHDIMGYCLGKNDFIAELDRKAGFDGFRFLVVFTDGEWAAYHRIVRDQIFADLDITYDPNHPSITDPNHHNFVFYKGKNIVSVAQVELLNSGDACLRIIATDTPYQNRGYGSEALRLVEKWVKQQGHSIIRLHANPAAEQFYKNAGYKPMAFDDVSIDKNAIDLGKKL